MRKKKTQNNDIMSFAPPGVWISFSFTLCARMRRSCAGIAQGDGLCYLPWFSSIQSDTSVFTACLPLMQLFSSTCSVEYIFIWDNWGIPPILRLR